MISIPHKTKQSLLLIKLLIVGAAFYFIYNQLANSDALDWEKFIILFNKISRLPDLFILLLSVLNHFLILKWQNLVSFYIKSPKQGNKTSPCCLDGWTIYSKWYWGMVKPCSLINQLPKKCCF
jgi:hypothetical protein